MQKLVHEKVQQQIDFSKVTELVQYQESTCWVFNRKGCYDDRSIFFAPSSFVVDEVTVWHQWDACSVVGIEILGIDENKDWDVNIWFLWENEKEKLKEEEGEERSKREEEWRGWE